MRYYQKIQDIKFRICNENQVTKEELTSLFNKVANDKRLTNNNKSHLLYQIKKIYKSLWWVTLKGDETARNSRQG